MTATVRARTARKAHLCEGCHWTPSLRGQPTIAPGHRYLLHTAFPDGDEITAEHPYSLKECVSCAEEREYAAATIVAGACGTFCCGDVPCARPHPHDGEHSCLRCAFDREAVAA